MWLKRMFFIINNKYTKGFFKVFTKFLNFFTHSHIVQGIFLILFKEIIAVIILIEALIIYFSTYKYLRYQWIVAKKIYAKITHEKNAERELSTYFKTILLTKLEAKNTMYCNAINMVENLPKWLKFSIVLKGQNILKKLHKKFKKEAYSNAFSCKVHHIVAPSVWAYKKHRAKKVAKLYDTLFCILPFEPKYFTPFGLKTIFIGYPPYFRMQSVLQNLQPPPLDASSPLRLRPADSGRTLRSTGPPPQNQPTQISITLGSRLSELKHHIPAIKKTISILNKKFPQKLEFCIILLPHLESVILNAFKEIENVRLIDETKKWETVVSSRFVIGKSGTNVMEFAFLGVPSIVYYKANFITACIIKLLIYNKIGTLLNFMAGRFILPEFIQEYVADIHTKAIEWIESDAELETVKGEMQKELEKFASRENAGEIVLGNLG